MNKDEIKDILGTLRKLSAHAAAITGNGGASGMIVSQAVQRHPRGKAALSPPSLDGLIKEVTDLSRSVPPGNEPENVFSRQYWTLPFEAKACLSLRVNFGLDFSRIGPILEIHSDEAEILYGATVHTLAALDSPGSALAFDPAAATGDHH